MKSNMGYTQHLLFYIAVVLLTKSQENCHCVSQIEKVTSCDDFGPAYEAALHLSRNGCKTICTAPSSPYLGNGQQTAAAGCVSAFAAVRQYREECWDKAVNPSDKPFPFALEAVYQEFRLNCDNGCQTKKNAGLEKCTPEECDTGTSVTISGMFQTIADAYAKDETGCLKTGCDGVATDSTECEKEFKRIFAFHEKCSSLIPEEIRLSFQSFKALVKEAPGCDVANAAHCSHNSVDGELTCTSPVNVRWAKPSAKVDITLKFEKPTLEVLTAKTPAFVKIFAEIHGVHESQIIKSEGGAQGITVTAGDGYSKVDYQVQGVTVGYASYIRTLVVTEGYLYDIIRDFKDKEDVSVKFSAEKKSEAKPDPNATEDAESEVVITFQVSKTSQDEVMSNQPEIEAAIAKAHAIDPKQVSITNVIDKVDRDGNKTENITEIMYSVSDDKEHGSARTDEEEKELVKRMAAIRDQASEKDFIESLESNIKHVECQDNAKCLENIDVDHHDITVIIIGDMTPRAKDNPSSALGVSQILLALLLTAAW